MEAIGPYLDGWHDVEAQLQLHLYHRNEAAMRNGNARKDAIESIGEFEEWRGYVREKFLEGIGGLPEAECELSPEIRGEIKDDGFTIRKMIYQSLPGWYVTANLYIPDELESPSAAVLFLNGHSREAKAYPAYQNVCQRLAKNGFIVLNVDPLGQGERFQYFDATTGTELVGCSCEEHCYEGLQCWWLGQSPTRYFLYDAMRGIDYLQSLPEVDAHRIGATGCSGGGTQTSMVMLGEPRLAAAVPATFIMHRRNYMWTGQAQDGEQIFPGTTAAGIDHDDYLAVMAPKPVMVALAAYDYFPLEGAQYSIERARRVYELFDAPDNLQCAIDPALHGYTDNLAKAALEWFAQHLQGKSANDIDYSESQLHSEEELWCTRTGQLLGDNSQSKTVWHMNLEERKSLLASRPAGNQRIVAAREWLREQVNRDRHPVEFHPRLYGTTYDGDMRVEKLWWWSEEDIINAAVHCHLYPAKDGGSLVIMLFESGTQDIPAREAAIRERCRRGESVLVVDVRGWGALLARRTNAHDRDWFYGTHYKLLCEAIFLGDSLAAMRVYDLLRAVEFARQQFAPTQIILSADPGVPSIYAMLAALLDESVRLDLAAGLPAIDDLVDQRFYRYQDSVHGVVPGLLGRCTGQDLAQALAGQSTGA